MVVPTPCCCPCILMPSDLSHVHLITLYTRLIAMSLPLLHILPSTVSTRHHGTLEKVCSARISLTLSLELSPYSFSIPTSFRHCTVDNLYPLQRGYL